MTVERTERLSYIHRYPIVSFFIVALILGTGTLALVFRGLVPERLALSSVLSASIAGIVLTAMLDGKAGLKLLLSRVLIWRVGIGYWFFAVLFFAFAVLIGSLFNPIFNGDPVSFSNLKLTLEILPMFIIFFIVAGLGQELGWAGFLLPRLQAQYGALASSLIRAALIVIWHLPLLIYSRSQPYAIPDFPYGEWIVQKGFLITFFAMVMLSLPWSIFITWMFNNTKGSLLLVAILHGSEIWLVFLITGFGISPKNLDNCWGYGIVMLLAAMIIIISTGPENLSRKHQRIAYHVS